MVALITSGCPGRHQGGGCPNAGRGQRHGRAKRAGAGGAAGARGPGPRGAGRRAGLGPPLPRPAAAALRCAVLTPRPILEDGPGRSRIRPQLLWSVLLALHVLLSTSEPDAFTPSLRLQVLDVWPAGLEVLDLRAGLLPTDRSGQRRICPSDLSIGAFVHLFSDRPPASFSRQRRAELRRRGQRGRQVGPCSKRGLSLGMLALITSGSWSTQAAGRQGGAGASRASRPGGLRCLQGPEPTPNPRCFPRHFPSRAQTEG